MTAAPSEPTYVRQQHISTTIDLVDCKSRSSGRILGHNHAQRIALLCSETLGSHNPPIQPDLVNCMRTSPIYFHFKTALNYYRSTLAQSSPCVLLCSPITHVFSGCSPATYIPPSFLPHMSVSHPRVSRVSEKVPLISQRQQLPPCDSHPPSSLPPSLPVHHDTATLRHRWMRSLPPPLSPPPPSLIAPAGERALVMVRMGHNGQISNFEEETRLSPGAPLSSQPSSSSTDVPASRCHYGQAPAGPERTPRMPVVEQGSLLPHRGSATRKKTLSARPLMLLPSSMFSRLTTRETPVLAASADSNLFPRAAHQFHV